MAISQAVQAMSDGSVMIAVTVPYTPPAQPGINCGTNPPAALNLSASQLSTGGSLAGGHSYFYYFAAVDGASILSAVGVGIQVDVPAGTNTNQVTLSGIGVFDQNAAKYQAYRALDDPSVPLLIRAATAVPSPFTFTDTGLSTSQTLPPIPGIQTVRVYWRKTGDVLWQLGAEAADPTQTSMTFLLPWNLNGQQIDIQLRSVGVSGVETPQSIAPVAMITLTGVYPTGLSISNSGGTGGNPIVFTVQGALPPTLSAPFDYTTNTTSLSLIAEGQSILRTDGTQTSLGNSTTTITGLLPGHTYYFYPYYDESLASLEFVSSAPSAPSLAGVTFDGSTGYVSTATNQSIATGTAWSIELWFRTTSATTGVFIEADANQTGAPNTTTSNLGIGINSSGEIFGGPNHNLLNWNSESYADGAWHQVVLTFAGGASGTYAGYIDGAQLFSLATSGYAGIGTAYWRIGNGGYTGSSKFFNGTIAAVSIYSGSVLSAAQVANHYNAMINSGPATYNTVVLNDSPTYYWELNETSGSTATESVAGVNIGTYHSTVTLNQAQSVVTPTGSPAIAWDAPSSYISQQQNLQGRVPLSSGSISAATTTSGTGGGTSSGGGTFGCFSGETLVRTRRGNVCIKDVLVGDVVLTARETWKTVCGVSRHDYSGPVVEIGGGEFSTPNHRLLKGGLWQSAEDLFRRLKYFDGEVFNLSVEVDSSDDPNSALSERSFTLANGLVAHNVKVAK